MVYVPILALTGIEGKLFHPMALTVIFALTAAFVLSLTFVPAMVALLVRGKVAEEENKLMRIAKRAYAPVLDFALRQRALVLIGAVVLLVAAGYGLDRWLALPFLPAGFPAAWVGGGVWLAGFVLAVLAIAQFRRAGTDLQTHTPTAPPRASLLPPPLSPPAPPSATACRPGSRVSARSAAVPSRTCGVGSIGLYQPELVSPGAHP